MKIYTTAPEHAGRVTSRIPVELTPAEARDLANAADALERIWGPDDWPLLTGLLRIRRAWRVEEGE